MLVMCEGEWLIVDLLNLCVLCVVLDVEDDDIDMFVGFEGILKEKVELLEKCILCEIFIWYCWNKSSVLLELGLFWVGLCFKFECYEFEKISDIDLSKQY